MWPCLEWACLKGILDGLILSSGCFFKRPSSPCRSTVTSPQVSLSLERSINYDILISVALITSTQILSYSGTFTCCNIGSTLHLRAAFTSLILLRGRPSVGSRWSFPTLFTKNVFILQITWFFLWQFIHFFLQEALKTNLFNHTKNCNTQSIRTKPDLWRINASYFSCPLQSSVSSTAELQWQADVTQCDGQSRVIAQVSRGQHRTGMSLRGRSNVDWEGPDFLTGSTDKEDTFRKTGETGASIRGVYVWATSGKTQVSKGVRKASVSSVMSWMRVIFESSLSGLSVA